MGGEGLKWELKEEKYHKEKKPNALIYPTRERKTNVYAKAYLCFNVRKNDNEYKM